MGVRGTPMIRKRRSEATKLKAAEKAELLAVWKATLGKPPPFATSRELLAMALAWASPRAKIQRV
jgi:hypothetical protein